MTLLVWKITLNKYFERAIPDTDSTYIHHTMWGATNAALVTVEDLRTHQTKTEWISSGNFQLPPRAIDLDKEQYPCDGSSRGAQIPIRGAHLSEG